MLDLARETVVKAPPADIWAMAYDMARNPLKYMPLATAAQVTPSPKGGLDSSIEVFGFTLKEDVAFNETDRVVTYTLRTNPDWSGTREIRIGGGPKRDELHATSNVSIRFQWTPLSPKAKGVDPEGVGKLVQAAVDRIREFAEAKAKGR